MGRRDGQHVALRRKHAWHVAEPERRPVAGARERRVGRATDAAGAAGHCQVPGFSPAGRGSEQKGDTTSEIKMLKIKRSLTCFHFVKL